MKSPKLVDPNAKLPENSIVWYILALSLMAVSIAISIRGDWQTDGFLKAVYDENCKRVAFKEISPANNFSITPNTISVVWAMIIYGALLARRYVRNFSNPPTLILVAANIFFAASLIESFLPAQSITLLHKFGMDLKLNPQTLLIAAVLLSWIGMRSLSGVSILILGWAFLARAQDMNQSLGMWGAFYVLCGFLSLMIQAKLPYMIPEGGWGAALLQDFGAIRIAAARNVAELQSQVQTAAGVVASVAAAANGMPPEVVSGMLQRDSGNARHVVPESDVVKL